MKRALVCGAGVFPSTPLFTLAETSDGVSCARSCGIMKILFAKAHPKMLGQGLKIKLAAEQDAPLPAKP